MKFASSRLLQLPPERCYGCAAAKVNKQAYTALCRGLLLTVPDTWLHLSSWRSRTEYLQMREFTINLRSDNIVERPLWGIKFNISFSASNHQGAVTSCFLSVEKAFVSFDMGHHLKICLGAQPRNPFKSVPPCPLDMLSSRLASLLCQPRGLMEPSRFPSTSVHNFNRSLL